MANKPYKIMVPEELIARLDEAARQYGRRTGNKVAEEVLGQYLDFWIQAEEARQEMVRKQRALLEKESPSRAAKRSR